MVAVSAAITSSRSTIHSLAQADITEPRRIIKEYYEKSGEKLSFTAYIVYCLSRVISQHPHLNSFIRRNRLITLDDITISVLVEREFMGEKFPEPVVVEAAQDLTYIEIDNLIRKAGKKSGGMGNLSGNNWIRYIPRFLLKPFVRMAEGNITMAKRYGKIAVTAVGMFSREPVWFIPHGSGTVLITVGSIEKRILSDGNTTSEKEFLSVTGSFDHAVVDGAPAARFMNQFIETLKSGILLNDILSVDRNISSTGK